MATRDDWDGLEFFGAHGPPGGRRVDTPVGTPCLHCKEAIAPEELGLIIAVHGGPLPSRQPIHRECHLRLIVGSVKHQRGECSCFTGDTSQDDDADYPTARDAARAALREFVSRQNVTRVCAEHAVTKAGRYAGQDPETFVGQIVKLEFPVTDPSVAGVVKGEWMWVVNVRLATPQEDPTRGALIGMLNNDPEYVTDYRDGSWIQFDVAEIGLAQTPEAQDEQIRRAMEYRRRGRWSREAERLYLAGELPPFPIDDEDLS